MHPITEKQIFPETQVPRVSASRKLHPKGAISPYSVCGPSPLERIRKIFQENFSLPQNHLAQAVRISQIRSP